MRHILILLFILLFGCNLSAQMPTTGESYWSLHGGATLSRLVDSDYTTHYQRGFCVGASYAFAISFLAPFYFESGLNFTQRGGVDDGYILGYDCCCDLRSYNLELPLQMLFRLNISSLFALSINLGTYLSVALSSNAKCQDLCFDPYSTSSIDLRDSGNIVDCAIFQRFDSGARIGVSLYISNFFLNFSSVIGCVNLFKDDIRDSGYSLKSRSFDFVFGYIF